MTATANRHFMGGRSMGGFSLVEALIAMLLFAVGFLAIAGLQLRGMQASRISFQSSTAVRLAEAMADKILANRQVLLTNKEIYSEAPTTTPIDCYANGVNCTTAQVALNDLAQWLASIEAAGLTNFAYEICYDDSINDSGAAIGNFNRCMPNEQTLVIKLRWRAVANNQTQTNEGTATLDNYVFLPVLNLL